MQLNFSYSSSELLHECARKFELEKLSAPEGITDDSLDLVCGSSFGIGLQSLLSGDSLERALYHSYIAWTLPSRTRSPNLEIISRTSRSIYEQNKKKAWFLVAAHLEKFHLARPDKLEGWKLWTLPSGRLATEVGFRIRLPNGSYHRGFIDAILYRDSGSAIEYATLEVKTSGFDNPSPALFQNSDQGNCYSFVVDYITNQINPIVFYFVACFPKLGQEVFDFWKTSQDKVGWIATLALDMQMIGLYRKANHFPMNGKSCYNFFRDCKYLGICNLPRNTEVKDHPPEPAEMFDYDFSLEQLLLAKEKMYAPQ